MNVKEQIKRELQVDFKLSVSRDRLVFWETIDYNFATVLTKSQVKELIDTLTELRDQMG